MARTRSVGMAPARRIRTWSAAVQSTTVEAGPPWAGPPSRTRSTASPSCSRIAAASDASGSPETLAEVTGSGPTARASQMGVEIHQQTPVTGLIIQGGKVKGVQVPGGAISAGRVMQAVAGMTSVVAQMAGFRLPIRTIPLQACVSVPLKPFLDQIIVSGSLHVYVSQSSRGELVMGGSTDPYGLYSTRSTLDFKEGLLGHMLELLPMLGEVKILRQWAGMADMTPDFSPIMGLTPLENYYIDSGWGTWGFKATPVCGKTMAYTVANNAPHELIKPFSYERFLTYSQVGEKGAASVGH